MEGFFYSTENQGMLLAEGFMMAVSVPFQLYRTFSIDIPSDFFS